MYFCNVFTADCKFCNIRKKRIFAATKVNFTQIKQPTMDLKDILAISGQPGLYKFVAQSSRGVIVEALADGKRQNIPPTARVSSMSEIAIYTDSEEKPLEKILQDIFRALDGKEAISHKASNDELVTFFGKMIPDYDQERVHVSDMKKVIAWYNILLAKGLIDLEEPKEEEEIIEETEETPAEKKAEKKPAAKKAAAKPKAASAPKVSTSSKAAAPKMTRGKKG